MPNLNVLVGPPGSGKTTYCLDFLGSVGLRRISQDEGGRAAHFEVFMEVLKTGEDIVLDRMNFSREQRYKYILPARAHGYSITITTFYVPHDVCLERCLSRADHPTITDEEGAKKALHWFFAKFEKPEGDEADYFSFGPSYTGSRKKALVIDLDGTLCDINHRLHFVKDKKKDWDSFFKALQGDRANLWCQELVWSFLEGQETEVVFCSGRPDDHKESTLEWLYKNDLSGLPLHMRRAGDFRQDHIVKEIILDFELLPRYDILFAVDDRKQVVDMWRRRGITCLQCAEGEF